MADPRLVAYCGQYCGFCAQNNRIPRKALDLRDSLEVGYEIWGQYIPGFKDFWAFLNDLVESRTSRSCREGTSRTGFAYADIRCCFCEVPDK